MARIFITGSSDGLGSMAAQRLIQQGHRVVIHARNSKRDQDALLRVPQAESVLTADLSRIEQVKQLAADVNALGSFDAVIHNAGIYNGSGQEIFAVNALAPYILTCLIHRPRRLIYIASDMHLQGNPSLAKIRSNIGSVSYSDSKFYVVLLMKAIARKWPDVCANAVDPGWVPTKMGGPSATDDLEKGCETQAWLAAGDDDRAKVSGRYFYHRRETAYHPLAGNVNLQEEFLATCEQLSGATLLCGKM